MGKRHRHLEFSLKALWNMSLLYYVLPDANPTQMTPSKNRAATREAMSPFFFRGCELRLVASGWVSSGEWRCCCEEPSGRCIYTCKRENESLPCARWLEINESWQWSHTCPNFTPDFSLAACQNPPVSLFRWFPEAGLYPSILLLWLTKPCVPHTIHASQWCCPFMSTSTNEHAQRFARILFPSKTNLISQNNCASLINMVLCKQCITPR